MNNQNLVTIDRDELAKLVSDAVRDAMATDEKKASEKAIDFLKETAKDNSADAIWESYKGLFIEKLSTFLQGFLLFVIVNFWKAFTVFHPEYFIVALIVLAGYFLVAQLGRKYYDTIRNFAAHI